tara:strand:+ start:237 stop:437 length:201 start_codon:yes stop_codon:yes gene_type:complete
MSSWCIEYWKAPKKTEGSHAQMREQLKWVKPEHKDISRRYFSDYKSASKFAKSIFDYGYHTNVIKE